MFCIFANLPDLWLSLKQRPGRFPYLLLLCLLCCPLPCRCWETPLYTCDEMRVKGADNVLVFCKNSFAPQETPSALQKECIAQRLSWLISCRIATWRQQRSTKSSSGVSLWWLMTLARTSGPCDAALPVWRVSCLPCCCPFTSL